ncbi:MAG TPA: phosphotransferase, partial [Thermoanaerobaculia bacterium]|nr:phosphotransferase [Thermoanaerobaculia bacterium]
SRRYARLALADGTTAILATYPPDIRATCPRFLATTELLAAAAVRVPRVLAADCEHGLMLLEDMGPLTFADWALATSRPWSELTPYFADALSQARRIAALPPARVAGLSPPLGRELLEKELRQTWDLFLAPRGLLGDGTEAAALAALFAELCARLAEDPAVPCHRDFMARNLMPLPGVSSAGGPSVAVLDHQDLRLGPPAYDLASLLNDTLFPTPEVEEALLAQAAPTPAERLRYHRAAAQRTLKAVGTYAAFARRGAARHLPLIPRTLGRCLGHLERLPESAPLAPRLAHRWRPALEPPGH